MILLMAWALLRQRPTAAITACAGAALVGVLLVVAAPDVELDPIGVGLMLAGVAACALYTVVSGRYLGDSSTLGVILLQQTAALGFAVALLAVTAVVGRMGDLGDVSATGWASALVAGALYYGVAFWFWVRGLRTCSPAVAGLFINLVPVFGVAAAAVLLDERLVGRQWLGAALVIGAVSVLAASVRRSQARDRPSSTQPVMAAHPGSRSERCSTSVRLATLRRRGARHRSARRRRDRLRASWPSASHPTTSGLQLLENAAATAGALIGLILMLGGRVGRALQPCRHARRPAVRHDRHPGRCRLHRRPDRRRLSRAPSSPT